MRKLPRSGSAFIIGRDRVPYRGTLRCPVWRGHRLQKPCDLCKLSGGNENNARAKNAEFRRAKISDATFDILTFYIEEYKELILKQEYLFINVSGDYAGKPFKVSGVYAMLRRLEEKTGIKASPHMLRHYFANERRKDGWKLELNSQALGHRNIETTMKYLNITDEELIQVSDEFYSKHQAMYGIQDLL